MKQFLKTAGNIIAVIVLPIALILAFGFLIASCDKSTQPSLSDKVTAIEERMDRIEEKLYELEEHLNERINDEHDEMLEGDAETWGAIEVVREDMKSFEDTQTQMERTDEKIQEISGEIEEIQGMLDYIYENVDGLE